MSNSVTQKKGSLVVVGTGINALAQVTLEAKAHIEQAEKVLMHVPETAAMAWIRELNPNVEDLQPCYSKAAHRADAYELMIQAQVDAVQSGLRTVAVFYGHPGVFVYPSHVAIKRLRDAGYPAEMLPGISAEDCLFADLGIDPAQSGCVQHEATTVLFYRQAIDPSVGTILWQIGMTGDHMLTSLQPRGEALTVLQRKLLRHYPATHPMVVYEAPILPIGKARMDWFTLAELPSLQTQLAA